MGRTPNCSRTFTAPPNARAFKSIGTRSTDELAVMMDTFAPLRLTRQALALESPGYHDSWMPG